MKRDYMLGEVIIGKLTQVLSEKGDQVKTTESGSY